MGNYDDVMINLAAFTAAHPVALAAAFLFLAQSTTGWLVLRAIKSLARPARPEALPARPEALPAAPQARTETVAGGAASVNGNPILAQLVMKLRDEFDQEVGLQPEHVARWQRRLARHGVVAPRTVEECDALLQQG